MNSRLHEVRAGPYRIRGVSVGGIYTTLQVPELGVVLDAGMPLRSFAATDIWLFSHGHADHMGALPALLGIRNIFRRPPPRVLLPAEITEDVAAALRRISVVQQHAIDVELTPVEPGDEVRLRNDLWVRVFRTHHTVPSVGYQFFRRVSKLRPEFRQLTGAEIAARRQAGEDLFYQAEHLELAYATDTLATVLDTEPSLLQSRVLLLECTFLDDRKALDASRAGNHVHLDELLAYASKFQNEHLVLMHFSQLYKPSEVHEILAQRCPPEMRDRLIAFAPATGEWPG